MNKNISFTDSMTVDDRHLPKHRCRCSLHLSSFQSLKKSLYYFPPIPPLPPCEWQQGAFDDLSPT